MDHSCEKEEQKGVDSGSVAHDASEERGGADSKSIGEEIHLLSRGRQREIPLLVNIVFLFITFNDLVNSYV